MTSGGSVKGATAVLREGDRRYKDDRKKERKKERLMAGSSIPEAVKVKVKK